jgi:hypothetical protein
MSSSNHLPPGTVLDAKWRIERTLGEGGMGVVYGAVHVRNEARATAGAQAVGEARGACHVHA